MFIHKRNWKKLLQELEWEKEVRANRELQLNKLNGLLLDLSHMLGKKDIFTIASRKWEQETNFDSSKEFLENKVKEYLKKERLKNLAREIEEGKKLLAHEAEKIRQDLPF